MLYIKWILRFLLTYVLFIVFFIFGSLAVNDLMPKDVTSEPGLVPDAIGFLLIAFIDSLIVCALILTSRHNGLKLAAPLAFAYYGAVTFVMQIETWYFLSSITVDPLLLSRLFVMGIPTAVFFVPLSVWILGKGNRATCRASTLSSTLPLQQYAWKFSAIAVAYLILYMGAGYFIAWQNPELRAFYGRPGEALPFFSHLEDILRNDKLLFPFQIFRSIIWALCALPIIRGSRVNPWLTSLLVGLFFSIPQNIVHIVANPIIPIASVRLSHFIETVSSTFIFGTVVVWLLHRKHSSFTDLIGLSKITKSETCDTHTT